MSAFSLFLISLLLHAFVGSHVGISRSSYLRLDFDLLVKRKALVSKKRNAACPFGVIMEKIFVPALMAIASLSNCTLSITP